MKKLVFTAIAMIAFSGASMANTIEVKEEVVRRASCMQVSIEVYNELREAGVGTEEAQIEANAAYGECLSGN